MARTPPTPKWNDTKQCWQVRVSLPGPGEKRRVILLRGVEQTDVARATRLAALAAGRVRTGELVPVESGETLAEWADRWFASREDSGLVDVDNDRSRFKNHIQPRLGALPVGGIRRDDVEALVEDLDAKVQRAELSWKTASHVWGLVTSMFADASGAKRRDLRVREDNPAQGVHGPDRGDDKAKAYLYPSEFLQLVSCEEVPLKWRVMFAMTTYLYARAGEVNALTWADVDRERGVVHIHASMNRKTGTKKSTKTGITRRVPVERTLAPLLEALHKATGGVGPVSPARGTDRKLARQLQRCLRIAGITRAELFITDATRKAMTFHDLRSTGITWAAMRGDDPLRIKQRAGHRTFSTTEGYIREAENLRETNFGEPFPPLPADLLDADALRIVSGSSGSKSIENCGKMVEAPGIEAERETSSNVASSMQTDAEITTPPSPADDEEARSRPPTPDRVLRVDVAMADDALRAAVKAAIDAGDDDLADSLMALLRGRKAPAPPRLAPVLPFAKPGKR